MHFDTLRGWLDWQESFHSQVIDLGLERVSAVYRRLIPTPIHIPTLTVAGTNGKGSCVAMLTAIYRAQGFSVGTYTSPHILTYNERICINGLPVIDKVLCDAFERIEACRNGISLSFFEFSTLAALDIFTREKVDVQLLEVGLGGRLDAVNIIDTDAAIISSIGIDHAEWLGDTREAIAIEKAGIFRALMPAIIGDPAPPYTLIDTANNLGAHLQCVNQDFHYQCDVDQWSWWNKQQHYSNLPLPALQGRHQFFNASAVLAAITQLQALLPVDEQAIHLGLSNVHLNGRFQLINTTIPILLDVGHNPQAVNTLFEYVSQKFPQKRIHAVFAIMKDKDIKRVIEIMHPLVHDWFLAPLDNPRAASFSVLQTIFNDCGIERVTGNFSDFKTAFKQTLSTARADDLIVIFGSFFLVSAYLTEFGSDTDAINAQIKQQHLA